jgi:alcohol dehydrogenase YqhD (iron-dependent ADH family)
MLSFTYYSPTEVLFGPQRELDVAAAIQKYGGNRVLVVYGGKSAQKSGLLGRVERILAENSLVYESLGGVRPNPQLNFAVAGIQQARRFQADFILAVGGGSVIDTAKAIAIGAANPDTPLWDFWSGKVSLAKSLPVGVILTIAAAGSETSNSSVLTNQDTGEKRGLNVDVIRPKFAVLNPELTFTLPKYQIACGVVDIMMHTLDRYFTPTDGNELTDEIDEAILRVVVRNGRMALERPDNYPAMSELMWAGSLSHNGMTGLGAVTDFAPHQLGHELSARFDVAHGASLSAIWGQWADYCYMQKPQRFARFAENVWQISAGGAAATAKLGIERTVDYFRTLNMPVCFTELQIGVQSEATLRELADRCVFRGRRKVGHFRELEREDVYQIYQAANH